MVRRGEAASRGSGSGGVTDVQRAGGGAMQSDGTTSSFLVCWLNLDSFKEVMLSHVFEVCPGLGNGGMTRHRHSLIAWLTLGSLRAISHASLARALRECRRTTLTWRPSRHVKIGGRGCLAAGSNETDMYFIEILIN